jgi:SAM-dependent methyltransferase
MNESIKQFLNSCFVQKGVYYLHKDSIINKELEELYISIRKKESRIYDDGTVRNLPDIPGENIHYKQWQVRKHSARRILKYFLALKPGLSILELGCGNGWFSNMLSGIDRADVLGTDINRFELEQAARVFNKDNLKFLYADIFDEEFSKIKLDVIILNSSIQYFPDVNALIDRLLSLLNVKGEIHIADSPFYDELNIDEKKNNSKLYYESLGFPEMAKYYHHHKLNDIKKYKPDILYKPSGRLNRIIGLIISGHYSPFHWLRIKNK